MAFPIKRLQRTVDYEFFGEEIFQLKEDLVTVGWRILGSGTGSGGDFELQGVTGGAGGGSGGQWDVWVNPGDANNQASDSGSWVRIATPADAPVYIEYIFAIHTGTLGGGLAENLWRFERSIDGTGFVTGGSATQPPRAADMLAPGQPIANNDRSADPTIDGGTMYPDITNGRVSWVIGDVDDNYDFILVTHRDHGNVFAAFGKLHVGLPNSAWGGDNDPTIYIQCHNEGPAATNTKFFRGDDFFECESDDSEIEEESNTSPAGDRGGFYASYDLLGGHYNSGTYKVSPGIPCFTSNPAGFVGLSFTNNLKRDYTGHAVTFNPTPWAKPDGRVNFYKGATTSNLFKWCSFPRTRNQASEPGNVAIIKTDDDDTRYCFDGWTIPWDIDTDLEFF